MRLDMFFIIWTGNLNRKAYKGESSRGIMKNVEICDECANPVPANTIVIKAGRKLCSVCSYSKEEASKEKWGWKENEKNNQWNRISIYEN